MEAIIIVVLFVVVSNIIRAAVKKSAPQQNTQSQRAAQVRRADAQSVHASAQRAPEAHQRESLHPQVKQTMTHRLESMEHRMSDHPSMQNSAVEHITQDPVSMEGVSFEGCGLMDGIRPAWVDPVADRTSETGAPLLSRQDLARGMVMLEVLGPRGGRALNRRQR